MTPQDPFASWSDDYKESQARHTARLVKHFTHCEHESARHLKEAHGYYTSEQWKADRIEIEALDGLLNDLQQRADTARAMRLQAETTLDGLLRSDRSYRSSLPIAERRDELVRAAMPLMGNNEAVEPTPLEAFLRSARQPAPSDSRRRVAKRARGQAL